MKLSLKLPLLTAVTIVTTTTIALATAWVIGHRNSLAETKHAMSSIVQNAENTRESMARLHKEGAFNMEALQAELKKVVSKNTKKPRSTDPCPLSRLGKAPKP
jgi:hypothetical protein